MSSLDFANALVFGGFTIPSLLTRRAETEVEMREGQYLAIAGLMDNPLIDNVTKIPMLGDIPILGQFFRSKDARQNRTELLVLVTPKLVRPSDEAGAADRRARGVEVERLHGHAQGRPQAVGTPEEVGRVNVVLPRCLAAR